jgi:hypothetical protein
MRKAKSMGFVLLLLSSVLVLTTCGGGSGGGGGNTGAGGITYTGITTQATVNSTNSENLASGAYKGGAVGSAASLGTVQKEVVDRPTYLDLALAIEEAIRHIDVHAPPRYC